MASLVLPFVILNEYSSHSFFPLFMFLPLLSLLVIPHSLFFLSVYSPSRMSIFPPYCLLTFTPLFLCCDQVVFRGTSCGGGMGCLGELYLCSLLPSFYFVPFFFFVIILILMIV